MATSNFIRLASLALALCGSVSAADPAIEIVSKPHETRPRSYGDSGDLQLSADGKWAVFASTGNGLVTNANDGFTLNLFLRNNESGEISQITSRPGALWEGANGDSYAPRISADGSFIVFETEANNLVGLGDDEDDGTYAFLFSRLPNLSQGILIGPFGDDVVDVDGAASGAPIVSPDGKFYLFETTAPISDLDTNGSVDLYRINPQSEIDLVTTRSNDLSSAGVAFPSDVIGNFEASMSADGRFIAFVSSGTNHTPGVPSNAGPQIYLRDMTAQTNAWLTRSTVGISPAAAWVSSPVVSTNGEFVMFISSALQPISPSPATTDTFLYRHDIATGQRTRITTTPGGPVQSFALSDDGQWVAFTSISNQVFLHGFADSTNILVSSGTEGQFAAGISTDESISADGRYVVFASSATNLTDGVTDELFQTYRFDRESGEVTLLSRAANGIGGANNDTYYPTISADGSIVGFMSYASNLVTNDNPLSNDLFLVSASGTGSVILASAPHTNSLASGAAGQSFVEAQAISLDGRFVVFSSDATDIIPNDTNSARDIFIRDLQAGTTIRASNLPDGSAHTNAATFIAASADAERIAYTVNESVTNVLRRHIYIYDRASGSNSFASVLPAGTNSIGTLGTILLSADGRFLVFREGNSTASPLFIRDLDAGSTVQHSPGAVTFGTDPIAISPNGGYLLTRAQSTAFALHSMDGPTYLTNFTAQQMITEPFSWDGSTMLISTGAPITLTLLLRTTDGSKEDVTIDTGSPLAISPDGNIVAYLRKDDTNQYLWFFDARNSSLTPMAVGGTNAALRVRPNSTFSANSRFFAFTSTNSLTADSPHAFNKVYIYDTVLKTLRLAGVNGSGDVAEFGAGNVALSANGRVIVFDSMAANLVEGDLNLASDVFVNRFSFVDADSDGLEDGWESIYFDGIADANADSDGDGISNLDEFRAGTDPKSASSNFSMEMEINSDTIVVTSPAAIGMAYELQFCDDLSVGDWQAIGLPAVALSSSIAFEAALNGEATGFFRIIASQQ